MKVLLVVMALVGLGQWGIGTASADEGSYLTKLNNGSVLPNVQFDQPSSALVAIGYRVCTNTQAGVEQRAMIRDVWHNSAYAFDAVQAAVLVNVAQEELC